VDAVGGPMQSPAEVTQAFLTTWADDPAGAMATMVAPDIVYTLNVTPEAVQIGGETVGWDAVNAKMMGIRDVFDYLIYIPRILGVDGQQVRARIELIFRHKTSGELLMGQMRSVVTVRDGQIARVDEYVDAPLIESFMRMFAGGDAPKQT
jgi:ketosteroid isomerase-like protein